MDMTQIHLKPNELEILQFSHLKMCLSLPEVIISLSSSFMTLYTKGSVIWELGVCCKYKDSVSYSGSNMLICYQTLDARAQARAKEWAALCVSTTLWVIVLSDVCSIPATHTATAAYLFICLW